MEGGGEEEGFCEGKSGEGVRCLLNITKYGLYPTSILAPPWGLVPFLLPFFTLILFLLIYRDFCIIIFFFFPLILSYFPYFANIFIFICPRPPLVTLGTDLGVAT